MLYLPPTDGIDVEPPQNTIQFLQVVCGSTWSPNSTPCHLSRSQSTVLTGSGLFEIRSSHRFLDWRVGYAVIEVWTRQFIATATSEFVNRRETSIGHTRLEYQAHSGCNPGSSATPRSQSSGRAKTTTRCSSGSPHT